MALAGCLARRRAGRDRLPARPFRLRQDDLLRIAAGVERPSCGTHPDRRAARSPGRRPSCAPEQRGIGLMFQDYALFPHLTMLDNVMFGLKALPHGDAEIAARRALGRVGLADYAGEYPHHAVRRRAAARGAGARDRAAAGRAPDGRALLQSRPPHARRRARRDRGGAARERGPPRSSSRTIRRRRCAWPTASC